MSEIRLLTLDEIADLWKCPRRYARDCLTKRPEFPKPAPGSPVRKPVWLMDDIRRFLAQNNRATRA